PIMFVFENVPGRLSAMPDGTPITEVIRRDIDSKGYEMIDNIKKHALIDLSEFNVLQNRKRVILVGIRKDIIKKDVIQDVLKDFYDNILSSYKASPKTSVEEAIGDLPKCFPLNTHETIKGVGKMSHSTPPSEITSHIPR